MERPRADDPDEGKWHDYYAYLEKKNDELKRANEFNRISANEAIGRMGALEKELKCQKFLNDVLKQGSSGLFKKVLHCEDLLRTAIWILDNNDPWSFNGWRQDAEAVLKEADEPESGEKGGGE